MSEGVNVDPGHWRELEQPRIPALTVEEMNVTVRGIAEAAEQALGAGDPPNLVLTLSRRPRVFAAWLAFAAHLMPPAALPRGDTELDGKLLIELSRLVGHYEMLAMAIANLGIRPEQPRPEAREIG